MDILAKPNSYAKYIAELHGGLAYIIDVEALNEAEHLMGEDKSFMFALCTLIAYESRSGRVYFVVS